MFNSTWDLVNATALRQVLSKTGVIGKLLSQTLVNNTFALIVVDEAGRKTGHIYRVQPSPDDEGKLYRDIKEDVFESGLMLDTRFLGAPTYKLVEIGPSWASERF